MILFLKRNVLSVILVISVVSFAGTVFVKTSLNLFTLAATTVVVGVLMSKIIGYFRHMESVATANRIFLLLLCIVVLLPVLRLNIVEDYVVDNRRANRFPSLMNTSGWNLEYGREFEVALTDRICFRDILLKVYHYLMPSDWISKGLNGKDDWLFYKGDASENAMKEYQGLIRFSDKEMNVIMMNLTKQYEYFNQRGIKYYVLVAPNKEDVYEEYYPVNVKKGEDLNKVQLLCEYLEANMSPIKLVYPLGELLAHKDEGLLYWKQDTHWNEHGAWFGYKLLMENIGRDMPEAIPITLKNMQQEVYTKSGGDISAMLGEDTEGHDASYIRFSPTNGWCYVTEEVKKNESGGVYCIVTKNASKPYRVLILRDSFAINLLPYVSETFGEVIYLGTHDMDATVEYIDQFKPDIVIHELVGRYMNVLLTPMKAAEVAR